MGGACSRHWRHKKYRNQSEFLKGRDNYGDLDLDSHVRKVL